MKLQSLLRSLLVVALLLVTGQIDAQVSLDLATTFKEVKVGRNVFHLFADAENRDCMYYLPTNARLAEIVQGPAEKVAELSLHKYTQSGNRPGSLTGAVLRFTLTMKATTDEVAALEKFCGEKMKATRKIRVEPMPIRKASLVLFGSDGEVLAKQEAAKGVGPTAGISQLPFLIQTDDPRFLNALDKPGREKWLALLKIEYAGLTRDHPVQVKINWPKAYDQYQANLDLVKRTIGWFWWNRPERGKDVQTLGEKLVETGALTFNYLKEPKNPSVENFLEPVIKRINEKLLHVPAPKQADADAFGQAANWAPFSDKAIRTVSVKKADKNKLGVETFDLNLSTWQQRESVAVGLIDLSRLGDPATFEKAYVTTSNPQELAWVALPPVALEDWFGIVGVNVLAKLTTAGGNDFSPVQKLASWGRNKDREMLSYWTEGNTRTNALSFPIMAQLENLTKKYGANGRDRLRIQTELEISYNRGKDIIRITRETPVFNRNLPFTFPMNLVTGILLEPVPHSDFFNLKSEEPGLKSIEMTLTNGDNKPRSFGIMTNRDAGSRVGMFLDPGKPGKIVFKGQAMKKLTQADKRIRQELGEKQVSLDTFAMNLPTLSWKENQAPDQVVIEIDEADWRQYFLNKYAYDQKAKAFSAGDKPFEAGAIGEGGEESW